MNKYVLGIEGMKCGMCESHVNTTIRNNIKVIKVSSSHYKNETTVITELDLSLDDFKKILDHTGYQVTSFNKEEATKKLFGWR